MNHEDNLAQRLSNQANMIASVAHDLRQLAFRIALTAEMTRSVGEDHEAFERRNLVSLQTLVAMNRLIDDLDDYGSLQGGQLRLVCRPVRPAEIASSAVAAFTPLAASKHIELSSRIAGPLPELVADRDRLLQVVSNLLSNAMSMTPVGGRIEISVDPDGDRVRFSVSDTGPGIRSADLPHLFGRHWRSVQAPYAGRGLGLAIARSLVESHGGKIWADAQYTPGARVSFTVRLDSSTVPNSHQEES